MMSSLRVSLPPCAKALLLSSICFWLVVATAAMLGRQRPNYGTHCRAGLAFERPQAPYCRLVAFPVADCGYRRNTAGLKEVDQQCLNRGMMAAKRNTTSVIPMSNDARQSEAIESHAGASNTFTDIELPMSIRTCLSDKPAKFSLDGFMAMNRSVSLVVTGLPCIVDQN